MRTFAALTREHRRRPGCLHPEAPRSAVGSSALFRRKRRGKALDVVSAAIPGGVALPFTPN